jgi:hypothetical protein
VSITASDEVSGLGDAEFFVQTDLGAGNNRPLTQQGGGFTSAPFGQELPAGTYDIGVRVRDRALNWSGVQHVTLTVGNPTAVVLRSFSASRTNRGVVVHWRVPSAANLLGFHLYRGQLRISRAMLPAKHGAGGGSYRFVDRRAPRSRLLAYRLQAVELDGSRMWLATATTR